MAQEHLEPQQGTLDTASQHIWRTVEQSRMRRPSLRRNGVNLYAASLVLWGEGKHLIVWLPGRNMRISRAPIDHSIRDRRSVDHRPTAVETP